MRYLKICYLVTFPVLLLLACDTGGRRTGEIDLLKTVPMSPAAGTTTETKPMLLRARGYNVEENSEHFRGINGDFKSLSIEDLRREGKDLEDIADAAYRKRVRAGEKESPAAKELLEIQTSLKQLNAELEKIPVSDAAKTASLLMRDVTETVNYANAIMSILTTVREQWYNTKELQSFYVPLILAGRTLESDRDYHRRPIYDKKPSPEFTWLCLDPFVTQILNTHADLKMKLNDTSRLHLKRRLHNEKYVTDENKKALQGCPIPHPSLVRLEWSLKAENLVSDDRLSGQIVDFYLAYHQLIELALNVSRTALDPDDKRKSVIRLRSYEESPHEYAISQVLSENAYSKSIDAYDNIKRSAEPLKAYAQRVLADSLEGHRSLRVELEDLASRLAEKNQEKLFYALRASTADQANNVTFILKTLYLRSLGTDEPTARSFRTNSHGNRLLVTCSVKDNNNFEEAVYPVIFEKGYAPMMRPNRYDRVIYGPAPYNGLSFDVRLTVMQLAIVSADQLTSAFEAATTAVGTFNPEFSAITPVVNGLFGSIIRNIDLDKKEFDASFFLPQPKAKDKPDTLFLISETGHYILIKREHPARNRGEPDASKEQFYRDLIYDPVDGLLYHRRDLSSSEANFKPANLFREQSYAVIVVTDQYGNSNDQLGAKLREQVGQTLGKDRAQNILPTSSDVVQMITQFSASSGGSNEVPKIAPSMVSKIADGLKAELWTGASDTRRGFIVQSLFARADLPTRMLLGIDPEKWKRADLDVDSNGIIHSAESKENVDLVYLPEQANQILFPFKELDTSKRFYLLENSHGARAENTELKDIGTIESGKVSLAVKTDGTLSTPYLRALEVDRLTAATLQTHRYDFTGPPFILESVKAGSDEMTNGVIKVPKSSSQPITIKVGTPTAYKAFMAFTNGVLAATKDGSVLSWDLPSPDQTNQTEVTIIPYLFKTLFAAGDTNRIPRQRFTLLRVP